MPPTIAQSSATSDRAAIAAFYQEHGYYIGRGLVDPTTLVGLEHDFDRIVEQIQASGANVNARWTLDTTTAYDNDVSSVVIHTHQVQKYSAAWSRWLFDDRYLDVIESMIGPDIILHHTKLFLKPAGRGAAFPPHQDHGYFRTETDSMMAAVVYLSDSDESNGCLRVWPGSHKHGPIDRSVSMGGSTAFAARFPIEDSIPVEVKPGDVVFFSYLTVHGSLANRGDRPRKSVLVQVHSGKDHTENINDHLQSRVALRGWNYHMNRDQANAS